MTPPDPLYPTTHGYNRISKRPWNSMIFPASNKDFSSMMMINGCSAWAEKTNQKTKTPSSPLNDFMNVTPNLIESKQLLQVWISINNIHELHPRFLSYHTRQLRRPSQHLSICHQTSSSGIHTGTQKSYLCHWSLLNSLAKITEVPSCTARQRQIHMGHGLWRIILWSS